MSMIIKKRMALIIVMFITMAGLQTVNTPAAYAKAANIETVRAAIQALAADPSSFKESDRETVEQIWADFQALSAEDQATLDQDETHPKSSQPLGRVLESALWGVWSYNTIDNSTTLPDGTYDPSTEPALSSTYSKGKSTSSRQKPWSVKSVTVSSGKATATITVESETYSDMWMGGKTYPKTNKSGNCEFAGVPIDLNSTFYFAGVSTSMATPIAFSLTSTIQEPEPTPVDPPTPADYTAVDAALASIPTDLTIYTDETVAAVTAAVNAVVRDKPATEQTEVNAMAAAINNAVAALKEKPADYTAVDAAIASVPSDLTIYTDETVAGVTSAVSAVVRGETITAQAEVDAMAQAINNAIAALELKGEPVLEEKADYTAVDTALASIPADLSIYTEESVSAVKAAKDAVVRGKAATEQSEVDSMAQAINNAVAALTLKPADYTAVDTALAAIPKDLSKYTDKTAKAVTSASASVVRDKLITEQSEVDAMAQAITDAVNALTLKKKAKITILQKTNIRKYKAYGKKLKKAKTFTLKTKASSKATVTYKKAKKGKISIDKNGKVTLKKGLKNGKYTLKVKASAPATSTYKAVTRTIKIRITIK